MEFRSFSWLDLTEPTWNRDRDGVMPWHSDQETPALGG
jgi:hypothetical protein